MPKVIIPIAIVVIVIIIYNYFSFSKLKKQGEKFNELQSQLKEGQTVLTASGIYGKIIRLKEQYCEIEISKNVVVKIERFSIRRIIEEKD